MGRNREDFESYEDYEEYVRRRREYIIRQKVARRKRRIRRRIRLLTFEILILAGVVLLAVKLFGPSKTVDKREITLYDAAVPAVSTTVEKLDFSNNSTEIPDWIVVNYIDEGNPSRSGLKLDGVNNIVIHYVGNPGTTAEQNRNFYNQPDSNVSSHFVVGIDGHVIMCLPLDENSAASNHRNHDTISIEVCHEDSTGEFSVEAYDSLVKLVDWLMERFDLEADDVIRHYDVTGKMCPLYYVEHEDAWEQFKADL